MKLKAKSTAQIEAAISRKSKVAPMIFFTRRLSVTSGSVVRVGRRKKAHTGIRASCSL